MRASIEQGASERRGSARRIVRLQSFAISHSTASESTVDIQDLSATGFLMQAAMPFPLGEQIGLQISDTIVDAEVVWVSGSLIGCRFANRLSKPQLSAALLKSQPGGHRRDVEVRLRDASQRLAEVSRDIDAMEKELIKASANRMPAPQILVDSTAGDAGPRPDDTEGRLPLYVRGWTILLSSIFLWTVLLWAAGWL